MKLKTIVKRCVATFTGDETVLARELSVMHGSGGLEEAVSEYRKRVLMKYLLLAGLVAVCALAAAAAAFFTRTSLGEVERPRAGENDRSVPVRVEAEYDGQEVTREFSINIAATLLTDEEKDQILKDFAEELPDRIAPASGGTRTVSGNLNLPERDDETGIEIRWTSGNPEVLNEEGRVDITGVDGDSVTVELEVGLRLDDRTLETSFDVVVVNSETLYRSSIDRQLEELVESLSSSTEGDRVVLPEETEGGVKLSWKTGGSSAVPFILLMGMAGVMYVYSSRYDRARKESRAYREAVIMEFPNVVDKLVLLLNSGLTVYSALMRLSGDSDPQKGKLSPMASELYMIGQRVKETNASVIREWKAFASRMESADILRFCTILEDNLSKGSELSMKLENESENFMDMRRKQVQHHIRMIDSRMIIPMMAMLMSLILVTISPVITGF